MSLFLQWSLASAALASFAWLLFCLAREAPRSSGSDLACAAGALLGLLAVFLRHRPELRVLSDETDHLNLAWSWLSTGRMNGIQEWLLRDGRWQPLADLPPFRPVLFPALVALGGLAAGPQPWLGFAVNGAAFAALLFLLARRLYRAAGAGAAALGVAAASLPAPFALAAASGGYDLLALLLLALAAEAWWRKPDGPLALAAALCFAATRAEGLALLAFLLLAGRSPARSRFLALGFALPLVLQRVYFPGHVDVPAGQSLWSAARVPAQAAAWLGAFYGVGAFPFLVHLAGTVVLAWAGKGWWKRLWPFAVFAALYGFFLLGFHAGDVRVPTQTRLFLPYSFALLLAAGLGVGRLARARRFAGLERGAVAALALSLLLLAPGEGGHPMARELLAVRLLAEQSPENALFVYASPGHVTAFRRSAVQPWRYARDGAELERGMGKVIWLEALPAVTPAQARPAWVEQSPRRELIPLGGLRSLVAVEKP